MKTKMKSQNKKTLVSALLLLVSLALIFGVALLIKTGNFNDQGRASSGTIMVGQLIRSTDSSLCRKCIQQCPGLDNVLRDCNPMASCLLLPEAKLQMDNGSHQVSGGYPGGKTAFSLQTLKRWWCLHGNGYFQNSG
ncbi:MAG: hypothetical protein UW44_C0018G0003 [Candidatus Collierbacteria bacterium GW2011_GWB2_44_22]|uniref:Uncharacterized protein n=1 Tax=Candidatus Collierbacteria bacterium GW2011_GWB2_44_22 TaxID=1618387 RepID=A0A0G1HWL1_9BACT|nr:MAG: hypothetical protein UW44_C0018G0003 [Candidatus Collierbacteria bacterium GW2011_GWB2_44_22]